MNWGGGIQPPDNWMLLLPSHPFLSPLPFRENMAN